MRFKLIQYKFFRKYFGGVYYLINCNQLAIGSFWSTQEITSCQSKILEIEKYEILKS